ncbi:MAG: ferrous iron transport protein A [Defluviitaleaceae bacterium]|nr:ferrous iron transport protein A [Defluviitaleaceae bacterium]
MSLYMAAKNDIYKVSSVPNIGLLNNLGIRVGTKIAVQQKYAFGGPVLLNVEDSFFVAIGKDIATQITVGDL